MRVFLPSAKTLETARRYGVHNTDWETFKQRIFDNIHNDTIPNRELAEEFIARVPPEGPPALQYCTEIMTIIALRLHRIPGRQQLVEYLREGFSEPDASNSSNICLMGGLAFGALAEENGEDTDWVKELLDHTGKFQSMIQGMDDDQRQNLVDKIREMLKPLV